MVDNRALFVGGIRVAIGAGLVLAPSLSARLWAGKAGDTPTGQMFARAIGGRDVVLGALLMGKELGRARRLLVPLAAGGVAATGYLAGKAIDQS